MTLRRTQKLGDRQLTIGLDLGDRSSFYCVLNGAGEVILEVKAATNPEAMQKTFEKTPRSRIALETADRFSPTWPVPARPVGRLLSPIQHRSAQAQADLSVIRARYGLIRARTALICTARGLTKSFGERIRGRKSEGV